ncbi:glycine zipper 2TM domain-containing protein [Oceanimonas baumannii]|uniref:glycine zipper 2TM domain-containing protein n=1 Tax=Oceanimonas baumannii TaxID=129578 RepID=UPI001D182197|nr:glycine zipper 2TM domain-containing protein [Oceanimonas baumannii]MCC4263048.1 glycine zipper 2TM domain-containing protein [Oceanimonas baumannii]
MNIKQLSAVAILAALGLGGCANTDVYSGDVYSSSAAGRAQNVTYGTLVSVRPVKIQAGEENVVGTVGGGVIGGIAGSAIGGGTGRSLATAAGALAGAMVGSRAEEKMSQVSAVELEIRTDNGESLVVVQKADRSWQPGQRVRMIGSGSSMSVAPY